MDTLSLSLLEDAMEILSAAIEAANPQRLIRNKVKQDGGTLRIDEKVLKLEEFKNIYVIGAGKASPGMALELERILGDRISSGVISTKYGHTLHSRRIEILEAGHPVPDQNGLNASEQIYQLALKADKQDLVICVFSGGGSALLERLPLGIDLMDLKDMNRILLACGADIEESNVVRKHISMIKGGRLAQAIFPATCVSLILSDVVGDPLEIIASGPTVPDPTTFEDAIRVIDKHYLEPSLPKSVINLLRKGLRGQLQDTPKRDAPFFEKVTNIILGNNFESLAFARRRAAELHYDTLILSSRVQGEAKEIAKAIAAIVQEIHMSDLPIKKPACLLIGGETTVTVGGTGKGGRNQEFALSSLVAMRGAQYGYLIASVGTDGTDGPTDAAGGYASQEIDSRYRRLHLDPSKFLRDNDSYGFLDEVGGLIKTGPTGTNVMDIIIALVQN